jgi:hypothetical protein
MLYPIDGNGNAAMHLVTDTGVWAHEIFGGCDLGDARRTKRLVDMGRRLADRTGASIAMCCQADPAAQTGSYRLLGNEQVEVQDIANGGFAAVAKQAQGRERLLALEDTTTLSYHHTVADTLGVVGSDSASKKRGYLVHSVLLVDGHSAGTIGLIEQQRWCRDPATHGKKHVRKQRPYADKESYKWQQASEQIARRLGVMMKRTISVCDRESDIYEYLLYKREHGQRFVTRASVDRRVAGETNHLFATLEAQARVKAHKTVHVSQRGGRKARKAKLVLRAAALELQSPQGRKAGPAIPVHVVLAQETQTPAGVKPLCWRLLTTEPIDDAVAVQRVVRDYELRWRIEDYHKAWKSGVGVERQRLQKASNLERMLVITAFVAVRLLQLREAADTAASNPSRCDRMNDDTLLSPDEWQVLWASVEHGPPPEPAPSAAWAFRAIAKLGGFTDTKRTGRPGWAALWDGWFRLQERVQGYRLSRATPAR